MHAEMGIELRNNEYESCKQFRFISSEWKMRRKSLYVRLVIESGHKGSLLLLKSIVSEVKCKKPSEKDDQFFWVRWVKSYTLKTSSVQITFTQSPLCLHEVSYVKMFVCLDDHTPR